MTSTNLRKALTRQASGYTLQATVRDFYGPGDDKVIFWRPPLT